MTDKDIKRKNEEKENKDEESDTNMAAPQPNTVRLSDAINMVPIFTGQNDGCTFEDFIAGCKKYVTQQC